MIFYFEKYNNYNTSQTNPLCVIYLFNKKTKQKKTYAVPVSRVQQYNTGVKI